jgi:hypothetical protein
LAFGRPFELDLHDYVFDTLMRDLVGHDRRPAAFLIFVQLAYQARRGRRGWSHEQFAECTGLSKRTVQDGLGYLACRGLIAIRRDGPTEAAVIEVETPWRRQE